MNIVLPMNIDSFTESTCSLRAVLEELYSSMLTRMCCFEFTTGVNVQNEKCNSN